MNSIEMKNSKYTDLFHKISSIHDHYSNISKVIRNISRIVSKVLSFVETLVVIVNKRYRVGKNLIYRNILNNSNQNFKISYRATQNLDIIRLKMIIIWIDIGYILIGPFTLKKIRIVKIFGTPCK